jgi:hypothetical protein
MTFPEALQILASFERHGVAYVLVGVDAQLLEERFGLEDD